ncbi:short-chain dehydrogenase reductase sdr [Paraphaeosphaeria sporulosa]
MSSNEPADNPILKKFDVQGKNIVITGGCRGLGFTFAHTLAQCGANIAAIDLNEQPSADFASLPFGGNYKYYRVNVTDYEALKKTIDKIYEEFGSIDGCIPAAGIIRDRPFLEHTEKDWRDTIDVNLTGVFFTLQHCAAKMVEQKTGGSIVCISSTAGHKSLAPQTIAAYTASKFAVRGLAKQVAHEMAKHNIRVNSISPGTMLTDMLMGIMEQDPSRKQLFVDSCAMKRLADPGELAGIMLYLMSEASSYTTGQDFLVDGGLV